MAKRTGPRHQVSAPPRHPGPPPEAATEQREAAAEQAEAAGEQQLGPRIRAVVEVVSLVVAPTTLVTALLFYFGYARASATYSAFGIDQSVLGFSVRDYLLQSLNATFRTLAWLLLAALAGLWAHGALSRSLAGRDRARRRVGAAAFAIGLLLVVAALAGLSGWVLYAVAVPVVPLGLGGGAALAAYGATLRREPPAGKRTPASGGGGATSREQRPGTPEEAKWARGVRRMLLGSLLVLTLFWSVEGFAVQHGKAVARRLIDGLDRRPGVVVYSAERLLLEGPGVCEEAVGSGDDRAYRYRYSGLRFLDRTGGRYFLLPDGWAPSGAGGVIILPEAGSLRIELHRTPQGDDPPRVDPDDPCPA